jgi:hypothetical protein
MMTAYKVKYTIYGLTKMSQTFLMYRDAKSLLNKVRRQNGVTEAEMIVV